MSLELKGKIKVVFEKQTFASGFEKREFVITTEEKFPHENFIQSCLAQKKF